MPHKKQTTHTFLKLHWDFFFCFARERIKRHFLISNVLAGNKRLCRGQQFVVRDLRVDWNYSEIR